MKVAYEYNELVEMIDSTLLAPTATEEQLQKLCDDAVKNKFKAVVVNPIHVKFCKKRLKDTLVKVCTVAGFPLGEDLPKVKLYSVKKACKAGAEEIDVVMCISAAKAGRWADVAKEIKKIVKAATGKRIVKVILETSYLTEEEIVKACQICVEAGARFVKTSSGFAKTDDGRVIGATTEHVALMWRAVDTQLKQMSNKDDVKRCQIKAAGGIKTYEQALALAEAGATRIGTSSAGEIAEEGRKFARIEELQAPDTDTVPPDETVEAAPAAEASADTAEKAQE